MSTPKVAREPVKVLVIDTAEESLQRRADHMLLEGHEVSVARADGAARLKLAQEQPDVVLLADVGSHPQTLGLLRALRTGEIPGVDRVARVLTVGADNEALAITHYRAGSDLALPGSVSLPLLAAAVQMLADRAREGDSPLLRVGKVILDAGARKVRVGDRAVNLSRLEFDLLLCLAQSATKTLTKSELAREVWGSEVMARSSRTVDSHISRVRRKLNDAGADQSLQAVRGVGYRLER